jgi:hypothetical protein
MIVGMVSTQICCTSHKYLEANSASKHTIALGRTIFFLDRIGQMLSICNEF